MLDQRVYDVQFYSGQNWSPGWGHDGTNRPGVATTRGGGGGIWGMEKERGVLKGSRERR